MKQLYTMSGEQNSIRAIARNMGISRNTVRKYLRSSEVPKPVLRPSRTSKLDPYKKYIMERLEAGVDNCVVLMREIKAQGYNGSYTILKDYVQPLRQHHTKQKTMRYDTEPAEQAQVDFGVCKYETPGGSTRKIWAFVMVLSWSRAIYVEFIEKADLASFIRCHINGFSTLGGTPRKCLYDNAKVVVLGRDQAGLPVFNSQFMDFSRRLGFDIKLCHPYRPQTKGRVESGVKYVKRNFWPSVQFTTLQDLNRQASSWIQSVANVRKHGTTHERPVDRLVTEQPLLQALPDVVHLQPFLRETRQIGRDGFVQWENAWYGLPNPWTPGEFVQIQLQGSLVEVWSKDQRVAVYPRALHAGQRFSHPTQWAGLTVHESASRTEILAKQLPQVDVEHRPPASYSAFETAVAEV